MSRKTSQIYHQNKLLSLFGSVSKIIACINSDLNINIRFRSQGNISELIFNGKDKITDKYQNSADFLEFTSFIQVSCVELSQLGSLRTVGPSD